MAAFAVFTFGTEMFSFEPYDVPDDGEPVGVVKLRSLQVRGAYLDNWLNGVLRCCLAVLLGKTSTEIDLIDEGNMLRCNLNRNSLVFSFGDEQVNLGNARRAARILVEDARLLVSQYAFANATVRSEIEATIDQISGILYKSSRVE